MKKLIILLGVVGVSMSSLLVRWSQAPSLTLVVYRMGFASVLLCLTQSVPHIIFNLSNGGAYRHTSNISNISLLVYGLFTAAFTLAHFSLKNTSAGEQK